LGLVLGALWAIAGGLGLLVRPQWVGYHALFEARGELPRPAEIMLVAIDEPSLEDLRAWPLPRAFYGKIVEGLLVAGATVVGIDVTFVQPAPRPADDAAFAAALARHPGRVVLAANFQPAIGHGDVRRQLVLPRPELVRSAAVGVVDLPFDADGGIHSFLRTHLGVDPEAPSRTRAYEGFDFALARRHLGKPPGWLAGQAEWLIDFAGPPGHVPSVPLVSLAEAIDAHDERILKGFRGKAVLIGATALRLQDQYPTPYSATVLGGGAATYMPGVEIHANAVRTLLAGTPIRRAPAPLEALLVVGLAVAAGGACVRMPPWWSALATLGAAAAVALLGYGLFVGAHVWLDAVVPLGALATAFVVGVAAQYVLAETHRRLYRRTFERYVAKEIVDQLLENPWMAPKLGGERREVTVLFSDIRSFTTISEQRTPEEVVAFLNAYLTAMAEVIRGEKGCIDKYIGDAILALWGNVVPMTPEEAARRAVRAALGMLARLEAERAGWEARGFPRIDIGVGINTGEAVVGNIGSPEKLEFGVIGDAINVASRIEGLTKEYGTLLVSGRTRELLGPGFACTFMANVKVKGRAQAVDIYRVDGEIVSGPTMQERPPAG
jgi:adenylate cyclase